MIKVKKERENEWMKGSKNERLTSYTQKKRKKTEWTKKLAQERKENKISTLYKEKQYRNRATKGEKRERERERETERMKLSKLGNMWKQVTLVKQIREREKSPWIFFKKNNLSFHIAPKYSSVYSEPIFLKLDPFGLYLFQHTV